MNKVIKRAIRSWLSWRSERRLAKAIPSYAANRARFQKLKHAHKSTKPVLKEMQAAVLSALRATAE